MKTEDIIFIRKSKLSQPEIAKMFGVSSSNISQIILNKTWKGV